MTHLDALEDEIGTLRDELADARRWLLEKEEAPFDGRVTNWERWRDSLQAARNRVAKLERNLADSEAAFRAAEEAYEQDTAP